MNTKPCIKCNQPTSSVLNGKTLEFPICHTCKEFMHSEFNAAAAQRRSEKNNG